MAKSNDNDVTLADAKPLYVIMMFWHGMMQCPLVNACAALHKDLQLWEWQCMHSRTAHTLSPA